MTKGTVTVQQENRTSALKCIIGIPYQDFQFFDLLIYVQIILLITTVHKH